jgi:hypothetical protein
VKERMGGSQNSGRRVVKGEGEYLEGRKTKATAANGPPLKIKQHLTTGI